MTANRAVLSLAARISADLLAGYQDYLAMCDDYAREGFRAPHCEHGTDLWTDYDNICGGCEDGITMRDGVIRRQYALSQSKAKWAKARKIAEAVAVLRDLGVEVDATPAWEAMDRLLTP